MFAILGQASIHVAGMFAAIQGYLSANNDNLIKCKKETGKEEDYALDITTIEKHLDQFYEEQRHSLLQAKLLEARLLEMRDKLNERDNLKANQNDYMIAKNPPPHNE